MAIPDFQTLMLPLLESTADGDEHKLSDLRRELASEFNLSEADLAQLLPSGRQARFDNRVGWARTFLGKAGLMVSSSRGSWRITEAGRALLAEKPPRIDIRLLERYEGYRQFRTTKRPERGRQPGSESAPPEIPSTGLTPEESVEQTLSQLRAAVRDDLLAQVRTVSPAFFERLVVQLLLKLGYGGALGDGEALGRSGDGGVDGVIREDKLGLDVVYVQAKRWEGPVGRPVVQAFVGSLEGHRARKGVLITTSTFTPDAKAYIQNIEKRVVLVDGANLAELMLDAGLGVSPVASYTIWRVDSDYFAEE